MTSSEQTVREIALENPASIRVFEKFGIDYCCGGRKPLAEACAAKNLAVEEVVAALNDSGTAHAEARENWATQPLAAIITHITSTHHAYVRQELPRLTELAERVVRRHGDTHLELPRIQAKLAEMGEELLQHCAKEEVVLFPYIAKLESAVEGKTEKPHGCFGSVANPVAMMMQEHDAAGALMADMRELSRDFTPPTGACPTYHAFYNGLREFEHDLHQHVHLENNILFPRAIEMEAAPEPVVAA